MFSSCAIDWCCNHKKVVHQFKAYHIIFMIMYVLVKSNINGKTSSTETRNPACQTWFSKMQIIHTEYFYLRPKKNSGQIYSKKAKAMAKVFILSLIIFFFNRPSLWWHVVFVACCVQYIKVFTCTYVIVLFLLNRSLYESLTLLGVFLKVVHQ